MFGEQQRNSWNEGSIIGELTAITQSHGGFPTCAELRRMKKSGLLTAIDEHGGINAFREKMGYEILKKHKRKSV